MPEETAGLGLAVGILFLVMLTVAAGGLVTQFGFLAGIVFLIGGLIVSAVAAFFFEGVTVVFLVLIATVIHAAEICVNRFRRD